MKKTIVRLSIAFTALCTGFILNACSESVEELEKKLVEAMRNGETEKVRIYAKKDCEKGSVYGCYTLAGQYLNESDYKNSIIYFEKSCNMNAEEWSERACGVLGIIYYKGLDTEQDIEKAEMLFKKGCNENLKNGKGCYAIGERLVRFKEYERAAEFLETGCNLNDPDACVELGALNEQSLASNSDKRRAIELFEKSCNLNSALACQLAAGHYKLGDLSPIDKSKALQYMLKACNLGLRTACQYYDQFRKE